MEKVVKNHTTTYRETTKGERAKAKYLSWRFVATIFGNIFAYVLTIGIAFVIIYPLLRRIGNAFKPVEEFYDTSIVYFPRNPTFEVVRQAFYRLNFKQVGIPSFLMALYVGLTQMVVALLVGYGFARFKFRGSRVLFACVILTLVVPPQTILIPLYLRFRYFDILGIFKAITGHSLKLIDTYWCQILLSATGLGWKNGLYIYLMRQYFRGVPKALEEAAYIDGARTFKAFVKIMVPSALPMMLTVFLFSFSWQWTDTFYTGTFLIKKKLLATSVNAITNENELMAFNLQQTAILIILIPLIFLFVVTQRYFVEGIERSGLTG
ncbi:MAG: carbohydrate ABC transporter permease [Eubacteriales bacterium]|nr:carbohydrate ABC transporter permease [Eubacteriales bacterium]MDY5346194.1 carbohydrate ABC transporter permease [Eubacteriales bacterium]